MIARFIRFWGITAYRDARWPTRDGVIPHVLFWELLRATRAVIASEQLHQYYPHFLAFAQAYGGKEARPHIDRALRELEQTANPSTP